MKYFLFSFFAFADFTIISGSGSAFNFCSGLNYEYCKQDIIRNARIRAQDDAQFKCQQSQGILDVFSGMCTDQCNPSLPPPPGDNSNTYVSCWSNCNYRCNLEGL